MPRGAARGSILGNEEKPRKNVERKATFLSFFKVERRGIKINKTNKLESKLEILMSSGAASLIQSHCQAGNCAPRCNLK